MHNRPAEVYVLPPRRKANGHAVGFVNFTDSQTAEAFSHTLQELARQRALHLGARISSLQGKALNQAFFLERCGWEAAFAAGSPMLFENGRCLTAPEIASSYQALSPRCRRQARQLLQQEPSIPGVPATEAQPEYEVLAQWLNESGVRTFRLAAGRWSATCFLLLLCCFSWLVHARHPEGKETLHMEITAVSRDLRLL